MCVAELPPRLYVDGHNLLHRTAFGFPARITSRSGRDITLVFGFFALIRASARSLEIPPEVIVVFDGQHGAAERRALLPPAREHLIMSTDKDFYQLLSPRVSVLNTQRRAERRRIRPAEVYDKHRVLPHQWCDYRALTGDKSDNIPGIRGVGDKTAARLLAEGAHLEDLDKLERLTGRIGYLIRDQWEQLILWRTLIQLRTDAPLPTAIGTHQPSSLPSAPDIIGALDLWK